MKDKAKVLDNAQEGKTKAMLHWCFFSLEEINDELIKMYVLESMDNFDSGKEIKSQRKTKPLIIPKELKEFLSVNKELETAFEGFIYLKKENLPYIFLQQKDKRQSNLD